MTADIISSNGDSRIIAVYDDATESPRTSRDNLGVMVFTGRERITTDTGPEAEHATYHLRNYGYEETAAMLREVYGATVVLPLHITGGRIEVVGRGEPDGVLFDTAASRALLGTPTGLVREVLLGELGEYNTWAGGDTWAVVRQRRVVWVRADDPSITREEWVDVDAVGGIIGREWADDAAADLWDE